MPLYPKIQIILFTGFLSVTGAVHAQCGMGIPSAGNPNCVPPGMPGSPYVTTPQNNSRHPVQQQPIVIRHKWADRWGAISADGVAGSLGFVTGYPDKRSAELAAVQECRGGGGRECRAEFSFYNSCAAFVVGDNGTSIFNSNTEEKASRIGLDICERKFGSCRVYRTGCSLAEAVPIR